MEKYWQLKACNLRKTHCGFCRPVSSGRFPKCVKCVDICRGHLRLKHILKDLLLANIGIWILLRSPTVTVWFAVFFFPGEPLQAIALFSMFLQSPFQNETMGGRIPYSTGNHVAHRSATGGCRAESRYIDHNALLRSENQWVDLRENLQETIDFPMKYGIFL